MDPPLCGALAFGIAFVLFVSRQPAEIFQAQFFAEEGTLWYARAHNEGFLGAFRPAVGSVFAVQAILASLAQLLPLSWAPVFLHLCAMGFQALLVAFLVGPRCRKLIEDDRQRLLLAFLFVALPNSHELRGSITNTHWHLSVLACLVLIARPPRSSRGWIHDLAILIMSLSSGPQAIFLTPIAAALAWKRRDRRAMALLALVSAGCLLQAGVLMFSPRALGEMGASPSRFLTILGRRFFLGTFVGLRFESLLYQHTPLRNSLISVPLGLAALAAIYFALRSASLEGRLFFGFGAMLILAALVRPGAGSQRPSWLELKIPGYGNRYFWAARLGLLVLLVPDAAFRSPKLWRRMASWTCALVLALGIVGDWLSPAPTDQNFQEQCQRWQRAPLGSQQSFKIAPERWRMVLRKRF